MIVCAKVWITDRAGGEGEGGKEGCVEEHVKKEK